MYRIEHAVLPCTCLPQRLKPQTAGYVPDFPLSIRIVSFQAVFLQAVSAVKTNAVLFQSFVSKLRRRRSQISEEVYRAKYLDVFRTFGPFFRLSDLTKFNKEIL